MRKRVQIAVDCADPTAMARFWAAALGYEAELPGPGEEDWSRAFDPAGGGPPLLFHRVPEGKRYRSVVRPTSRSAARPRATVEQDPPQGNFKVCDLGVKSGQGAVEMGHRDKVVASHLR